MKKTVQLPTIQGQYKRFFSFGSSTSSMIGGRSTSHPNAREPEWRYRIAPCEYYNLERTE